MTNYWKAFTDLIFFHEFQKIMNMKKVPEIEKVHSLDKRFTNLEKKPWLTKKFMNLKKYLEIEKCSLICKIINELYKKRSRNRKNFIDVRKSSGIWHEI